ncbi:MAG: tyrosine-type recombinase/integrase [Chloroflexi bacterium]|nr:tyrosine-type recombinase/integrase [Chloroflexota bacterium]
MLQKAVDDYMASLSAREHEHGGNNRNTIMAYRNDLSQLCGYLIEQGLEDWSQVTSEHIASYLLMMREGQAYRPTTIARKLAALKAFFRYMRSTGAAVIDPVEKLDSPRVQKDLPQVLTSEQINSLMLQVEGETFGGQRDLAMLHMLYSTGMRASELVSLNLDDFDPVHATVLCPGRNGRKKSERVLPLSSVAVEATRRYVEMARPRLVRRADEPALFLNHHGERLTRQGFWLIIKGYARRLGITDITPHMLRHSFAILMLNGGMELSSVQTLLGHAHISTTQVYSQLAHAKTSNE